MCLIDVEAIPYRIAIMGIDKDPSGPRQDSPPAETAWCRLSIAMYLTTAARAEVASVALVLTQCARNHDKTLLVRPVSTISGK